MMSDVLAASLLALGAPSTEALHPVLATTVADLSRDLGSLPEARRKPLDKLALWVRTQLDAGLAPKLVFICTHNSRRSHISQLWAHAAARVYGLEGVLTFSGGTEVTAFNPRAVAALARVGFQIEPKSPGDNPVYLVSAGPKLPGQDAFSKVYSDPPNPTSGFAAVMTCTQADQNCPSVQGAALRVSLPYEDPKASDGTAREAAAYDERVAQIGREMLYLFSRVRP